jgi:hypothetical protein
MDDIVPVHALPLLAKTNGNWQSVRAKSDISRTILRDRMQNRGGEEYLEAAVYLSFIDGTASLIR